MQPADAETSMRLATLAVQSANGALSVAAQKMVADPDVIEAWLLGLSLHVYWRVSGRTAEDEGFDVYWTHFSALATDAHRARFGELGDNGDEFEDEILEFYDAAIGTLEALEDRGMSGFYAAVRDAGVFPDAWADDDRTLGFLVSTVIVERAMGDVHLGK